MITHVLVARVECEHDGAEICTSALFVPPVDGEFPDDEAVRVFAAERGWALDEHGRDLCPRHADGG